MLERSSWQERILLRVMKYSTVLEILQDM
ncbi:hypothetical protein Avbf_12306 [Armadillidium vulgare]|nr:hypothetical protein Avbf_12306 [Armadillidium vulgare]